MLLLAAGHCAAAGLPADHPLVSQLLAAMARTGIRLIYSSQVVPPGLRARNAVVGSTIGAKLRSLLAPLGLRADPLPGGGYVIVPAPRRAGAASGRRASPLRPPLLEQVVVQTSRYRTSVLSSQSATRAALESSPETHNDAVRALQVIPGTTAAGYTARTHVRGSRDDEVLYRFDGVTLHEPYHLKELQSLFSPVDPTAVSSVTSWTGIAPIEYGNVIGGVVDIRPRRITRTTVDLQLSEQGASAMVGTAFSQHRGTVFADLRLRNQYAPVGWIDSGIGKPTLNDLIVHGTWTFTSRTRLSGGVLAIDDRRKYFSTENAQSKGVDGGEYYAWLRLEQRLLPTLHSVTLLSGEQAHEDVSGAVNEPDIVTGALFEHSWHAIYTLREELRATPARRWFWHAGAEAEWFNFVDQSAGSAVFSAPFYPDLQANPMVSANETVSGHALRYAMYGSIRWQADSRTIIDAGLRRDAAHYVGGSSNGQWSLRANIRYQLAAGTALRLGWGQEAQADVLDPHVAAGRIGPKSLRRLSQTDFSVNQRLPDRAALRAEVYYKDEGSPYRSSQYFFSPFALLPELAIDKAHVASQRSRMYGAELSLITDRSRPLSGMISYVWSRAEDRIAGVWLPRAWDEPNAVKINALWRHLPFTAAGSLIWHSGWPYTPLLVSNSSWTDPAATRLAFGRINSARLGNFFTLDVRLGWQHPLGRGIFQAFLDVYDLTGSASTCCHSYAVIRSPVGVYTLVERNSPWLDITPILGVRWHF